MNLHQQDLERTQVGELGEMKRAHEFLGRVEETEGMRQVEYK